MTVSDSGDWREATDDPHRGHGLRLIRSLMSDVTLHTDSTGTTVDMSTRISR